MSPAETSQQAVIDFLGDPATHGGAAVKRIDTHAASVFLAGKRALKIKRAVRFPVLDYSTLDRRKAACAAELEVNHPYAPAIYRRAVAITREDDGTLAIGGAGTPVEWAVEMRRFDETQTLDHLAKAERIDGALAEALGRAVARAHAAAPAVANAGFIDALAEIIAQNDAELRAAPELFPPRAVSALTAATRGALARMRALLIARERAGRVARCHGDLHLGNIVLLDGAPVLFDAIEFDLRIATGDVLYDLAFLLMDLIERGLTPAANIVLNRYLNETQRAEDLDALAALPLFLSLRAAIRAKVAAERWAQGGERARVEQSARDYFTLAGKLLAPPPPMLLAVGGLSGTGKSLLARALAAEILPEPGAVVLRSDVERKRRAGIALEDRMPAGSYTPQASAEIYAAFLARAERVLRAGHSVVLDAVFAREDERADAEALALKVGVPFEGIWLDVPKEVAQARVVARKADASDATPAVVERQFGYELGRIAWQRRHSAPLPR